MEYRASLDWQAKLITIIVFLLFGFIICLNLFLLKDDPLAARILGPVFMFAAIAGAYLFAPVKYLIKNDHLIIVRPVNDVKIPLSEIANARLLMENELGSVIRLWGSGGFFGYFGKFRSTRIGRLKLYATRHDKRILITTVDDYRLVISPDDTSIINYLRA